MKKGLISIIIPVFNGSSYIGACLSGIMAQSYKNLDVVVVDDGSTDDTVAIAGNYPVRIICQENKGVSSARNLGVSHARGEFIHFMDVDDSINVDFYKNLVEAIVQYDADIACCGTIDQNSRELTNLFRRSKVFNSVEDKLRATYAGRLGYVWRYLFRAEFINLNNIRFHEGRVIEDLIFSIEAIYYSKKLVTVPGSIYTYIKADQIKRGSDLEKKENDMIYAKNVRDEFARKHGFKIPGVNSGRVGYRIWRILNKLSHP